MRDNQLVVLLFGLLNERLYQLKRSSINQLQQASEQASKQKELNRERERERETTHRFRDIIIIILLLLFEILIYKQL